MVRGSLCRFTGLLAALAVPAGALAAPPAKAPPAAAPAAKAAPATQAVVCTPPTPPSAADRPLRPTLPQKPACLDAKDGCPGLEAYRYNDDVKAYNLQAQAFRPVAEAYFAKLNNYVKASSAYAQCEAEAFQK